MDKEKGMSQKIKTWMVILLTLALFVSGFFQLEKILAFNWDRGEYAISRKNQLLNLPQDSVDVLFLGASATYASFHPARLYERTGIRSFNLGLSLQPPLGVYYNLLETLQRHKPKVIIVDFSFLASYPDPTLDNYEAFYQKAYADIQSKELKKQFLQDVEIISPHFDSLPYISQFYKYHTRWNNLSEDDFVTRSHYKSMMLGGQLSFRYKPFQMDSIGSDKKNEKSYMLDERSEEVYTRLLQLCRENDITVVSVLPMRMGTTLDQQILFKNHAEENGLYFVDFNLPEVQAASGLDISSDFYDLRHVNILGARKMTDYIGNYILEQNILSSEAYPEADCLYQAWAEEYGVYTF